MRYTVTPIECGLCDVVSEDGSVSFSESTRIEFGPIAIYRSPAVPEKRLLLDENSYDWIPDSWRLGRIYLRCFDCGKRILMVRLWRSAADNRGDFTHGYWWIFDESGRRILTIERGSPSGMGDYIFVGEYMDEKLDGPSAKSEINCICRYYDKNGNPASEWMICDFAVEAAVNDDLRFVELKRKEKCSLIGVWSGKPETIIDWLPRDEFQFEFKKFEFWHKMRRGNGNDEEV